jgi:transposase
MRQLRPILRLHLECGLSQRECARALGVSKTTVSNVASMARICGLDWAAVQELSDSELETRLYGRLSTRDPSYTEPNYAWIHQELKRPGVTLQLLWEEYSRGTPQAYKYTSFCVKYRAWAASLKRSMRQIHEVGNKLFLDYAGQTMPIVDAHTGEISKAQIFVAVLGASNYTFACATHTQTAADWAGSIIQALEFFGGVPRLLVPDQPRSLMTQPDRYEPVAHRLLQELCDHYDTAVLPARPAHPRDKPKVENAVLVVERWILARLRNRRFFSLAELNKAIATLLTDLNERAFKKLPGCRREAFERLEQKALRALPATRMQIAKFKKARVNIDYHVELDGHYYSVPQRLVRTQVELRITASTVEIFASHQRVAIHPYNPRQGAHTTLAEHMPAAHRAHSEWSPGRLIAWGERIGAATAAVVRWQMEHRPHPEQGYRSCLGLKSLARQYGAERLEAACARAQSIRAPTYRSIKSILASGLDGQQLPSEPTQSTLPLHHNVRGPDYYH